MPVRCSPSPSKSVPSSFCHAGVAPCNSSARAIAIMILFGLLATAASAQTFKTIYSMKNASGSIEPLTGPLAQGPDGNLYGTDAGHIFNITPAGKPTILYRFCALTDCADGNVPTGPLVLGADGNFYGTTAEGGTGTGDSQLCGPESDFAGCGTIFKITLQGELTTLYSFCSLANCADGRDPHAGLVLATDGNFYGVTREGGTADLGTVFRVTPEGVLTTIYSFCSLTNCVDGEFPAAALIQGTDGNLYGTTDLVSGVAGGTIFKLTTSGSLTTLHTFCTHTGCPDGNSPVTALLEASDGNFYGTTAGGGNSTCKYGGCGTLFEITSSGDFTSLYDFCSLSNCSDGAEPPGALIQAKDGTIWGTTSISGPHGGLSGTVFNFKLGATPATFYTFVPHNNPNTGLMQATSGSFYGGTGNVATGDYTGYIYALAPATTVTTLTTSGSPSLATQPVTFTATVASKFVAIPNGDLVTFTDGSTVLANVPLSNGTASFTTSSLAVKSHPIKATYQGETWIASSSRGLTQVVQTYATTTTLTSSPNPSTVGQSVGLTATVKSAFSGAVTGNVTFKNGTTSLGSASLVSGKAVLTTKKLPAGTLTLSATYNGDADSGKSSGTTTQTVQ